MLATIPDVISAFGGPAAYAHEVGMSPGAAKQAQRRGSLNARWFAPTVAAAKRRGIAGISERTLAEIASRRAAPALAEAA